MTCYIDPQSLIKPTCKIGYFSVIMEQVALGENVTVGNNVTIYPGTVIGDNVIIGDNCVIGKYPRPAKTSTVKIEKNLPPLVIGSGATIGSCSVLYAGSIIGENAMIADLATVREKCQVGNYALVGRGVALENSVSVGEYTKIQTGAYITAYTTIEERVFIAPMVTTTNDNFMGRTEARFKSIKGATIRRGARVGGGSIILPGVEVAEESFIAAGALVTKNTQRAMVLKGFPARAFRPVPPGELLEEEKNK